MEINKQDIKILIVDDEPNNLRFLSQVLTAKGYQVQRAISGKLVLDAKFLPPPNLILLDIKMPDMDGYEVCRQLKAKPDTRDIPIIFISACNNVIDKVKAFKVGAVDYISKPFEVEEVIARVENQVNQQHLTQKIQQQNYRLQAEIAVRQRAEKEIFFLLNTTQAIAEAEDFHTALLSIIRSCCQTFSWDFGEAWIPNQDGNFLECSRACYSTDGNLEFFKRQCQKIQLPPNVGLPGRIWISQKSEWLEDINNEIINQPQEGNKQLFTRYRMAKKAGFKTCFGVPIILQNRVLAILVFYKKTASPCEKNFIELVQIVANQFGVLIHRKQTEEALRIAEEKYHSIIENAVTGFFQSTAYGKFITANPAVARIFGYESPADLINSIEDIAKQVYVLPERRQEFLEALEANDEIRGFESLVFRQDGSVIWISENTRAVRDTQGKLLYFEGTIFDITQRKLIQEALTFQQQQTDTLLRNILPTPIAQRLQNGENPIAESFADVTVLFADLVGFTEFSSRKTPEEIVSILNLIFSEFDQLAQEYNLEKIKTIGDAYMVVAGLPKPQINHAQAIANMALAMQAAIVKINWEIKEAFKLRIGINSGPVVAGVIGLSKFNYDLWGDTVNTAARMEANGIPGEIQVTVATYERLKNKFCFEERGIIPIKGKGKMKTYLLRGYQAATDSLRHN
jgi:PAS domain S-box-containing protein